MNFNPVSDILLLEKMQNASGFHYPSTMDNRSGMPQNSVEHQPVINPAFSFCHILDRLHMLT